jgi:hypothetical protein
MWYFRVGLARIQLEVPTSNHTSDCKFNLHMPSSNPSSLSDEIIEVLKERLHEFRHGNKQTRRQIVASCGKDTTPADLLPLQVTQHRKVNISLGQSLGISPYILQAVKEWFYNHGRKRNRKDKWNYVQKWTLKRVLIHQKREEIEEICREHTQALPGTREYIGGYQKALAEVVESLDATEVDHFNSMAEEWTKKSPPAEVQQR